jgi:class II aldolase/adducin N-terminal domain-containing protein
MAPASEGVVRFEAEHLEQRLEPRRIEDAVRALGAWREVLLRLGLLGQHPALYQGLGYGNVSARVGPFGDAPRGRRPFLITGTQTAGRRALSLDDFCLVERWDLGRNQVSSRGPVRPSSESLTHGALYDVAPAARAVLHGHAPEIWQAARSLGIPVTRPDVGNGTTAMALEVQRLFRETTLASTGILAMGGHEDGVIAFGASAEEAGTTLARALARALALEAGR